MDLLEDLRVNGEAGGHHQVEELAMVWAELVLGDQSEVFYPAHPRHEAGVDHWRYRYIMVHQTWNPLRYS